jgi:GNAT superfamily N-acetyltransferase
VGSLGASVTIEYLADRREFIPTVARWHHAEWGHLRPRETVEDRIGRVERDCGHCEVPTTFVALAGAQVLGSASLVENDMETRKELSPWLSGVFVAPEHRRRGVGAALVERVVREAQALGIRRLYLYTPGSGALYLRLGWSVRERTFYRELWRDQEITIMELATDSC